MATEQTSSAAADEDDTIKKKYKTSPPSALPAEPLDVTVSFSASDRSLIIFVTRHGNESQMLSSDTE